MEIGLYTFGDLPLGTSGAPAAQKRLNEVIQAAKLADELGLQVFGVGEHHRSDYAISSPAVVLSAIASVTKQIRLTSAVTILSSSDPVRVYEDFATLDLISNGRAEIMAGRGAFIESFPLFGYELNDYEELYSEKLDLLMRLRNDAQITWQGRHRPSLSNAEISPQSINSKMPLWIGAGGTPQSAVRAGQLGLPLNLANIGGEPARFKPFIDLYKKSGRDAGFTNADLKVAVSGHLHIQEDSQKARDEYFPYYTSYMQHNLPQRGRGPVISREDYEYLASPISSLFVGSPQEIADKICYEYELFGHQRFLAQVDIGGQPYSMVAKSIELLATKVLPMVQKRIQLLSDG